MNLLADILSSRVRAEVFRLLFDNRPVRLHLRELGRRSDLALATIRQDVKKLVDMDLLVEEEDGNRKYYSANALHPCYAAIGELVAKTVGLPARIQDCLKGADIKTAFLFGSMAKNEERGDSDIDLFVIGGIGLRELARRTKDIAEETGRELNAHCLTPQEFTHRLKVGDHLVSAVWKSEKIFLIGEDSDLKAMAR